jgi:hypothetical protein
MLVHPIKAKVARAAFSARALILNGEELDTLGQKRKSRR